jgi:hypothetical protein
MGGVTRTPPPRGERATPEELDACVEEFDRLSGGLVLLAPAPLAEVRRRIERFECALRGHLSAPLSGPPEAVARLDGEHRRFRTSIDQLWWFYRIVEADDHGGHRQALGQYGRLVAEALRRHRAEERELASVRSAPGPTGGLAKNAK